MSFQKGHKINLGKKYPNRKRVALTLEHKKNISLSLKGRIFSKEHLENMKISANSSRRKALQSEIGKRSTAKRWAGHIAKSKQVHKGLWKCSKDPLVQQDKKRFRNQRYKIRRTNAKGSHTFEEWVALKNMYKKMCLCCKKFEPDIKLSEDHIVPLSMGGTDYIDNIQPLCVSCNTRKHAKVIDYRNMEGGEFNFLN